MATHKSQGKVIALRDVLLPSLLVFLALVFVVVPVVFVSSRDDNNKGIRFFNDKNLPVAVQAFLRAIDKNYLHPAAHLNLALSRDRENKPLKALKIYSFTSKTFTGSVRFYSHFNQGELQGRLGDTAEALAEYQAALEFPMETEKTKQNMERLFLLSQNKEKKAGSDRQNKNERENQEQKDKATGSAKQEQNKRALNQDRERDKKEGEGKQSSEQDQQSQSTEAGQNADSAEQDRKEDKKEGEGKQPSEQDQQSQFSQVGQNTDSSGPDQEAKQNKQQGLFSKERQNTDRQEAGAKEGEKKEQNEESRSIAPTGQSKGAQPKEGENKRGEAFSKGQGLDEIETKAILDAIEKQESDIRKRLFQNRSRRRPRPGEKDW